MGDTTIEWTHRTAPDGTPMRGATWNPTVGCDRESPGCDHCYAKTLHDRRHTAFLAGKRVAPQYAQPFEVVQLMPDRLDTPLRTRRPTTFFVDSVSDLFYGTDIDRVRADKAGRPFTPVPFEFIDRVWAVMALCPQHTFIVLTKRADRMREYLADTGDADRIGMRIARQIDALTRRAWPWVRGARQEQEFSEHADMVAEKTWRMDDPFVLPNVWLVVSVENQAQADRRIPELLQTPAAVRGISAEPLLGPVDLGPWITGRHVCDALNRYSVLEWVIIGVENGTGRRNQEAYEAHARALLTQCAAAGVAAFHKQMPIRGRVSHDPAEWAEDLRVRQFPAGRRVPTGSVVPA
jgi:protein gp37